MIYIISCFVPCYFCRLHFSLFLATFCSLFCHIFFLLFDTLANICLHCALLVSCIHYSLVNCYIFCTFLPHSLLHFPTHSTSSLLLYFYHLFPGFLPHFLDTLSCTSLPSFYTHYCLLSIYFFT